jgi:2-polyprenyl-3-methyl-5-hydroxy-6-metoxy-1,4-benzoquinol methylase
VRCVECDLVALHPRPTFEETSAFYPASFWRSKESSEPPSRAKQLEAWIRDRLVRADFAVVEHHFGAGLRHLDVGCATGDFMELCQSRGTRSLGIELGAAAVERCREKGLDAIRGDLVEHDFGGETFDVITYNGVLEHVPDPRAHLAKCKTLLKSTGSLVLLGIPNLDSAGFRLAKERWIGLDVPRHIHQFSRKTLERLLEATGFVVTSVEPRSPRFNPPSLIASVFPSLHRHEFDAYEARTGKNPMGRKALLAVLLQVVTPLDKALCLFGVTEHLTVTAKLASPSSTGRVSA